MTATATPTAGSSAPASQPTSSSRPRRIRPARWLDARLIVGIALVVGAVLLGAKVITAADATTPMWAAARDLAPGAVLTSDDLVAQRVRLSDAASRYVGTSTPIQGRTLARPLSAGELVPSAALVTTPPSTTVTVPLSSTNAPKIARGQRIELWVTTKTCSAVPILDDVTVQDVQTNTGGAFGTGTTQGVVVRVPAGQAQRLVTALALDGAVVRAGVLDGPPAADANGHLTPLDACIAATR